MLCAGDARGHGLGVARRSDHVFIAAHQQHRTADLAEPTPGVVRLHGMRGVDEAVQRARSREQRVDLLAYLVLAAGVELLGVEVGHQEREEALEAKVLRRLAPVRHDRLAACPDARVCRRERHGLHAFRVVQRHLLADGTAIGSSDEAGAFDTQVVHHRHHVAGHHGSGVRKVRRAALAAAAVVDGQHAITLGHGRKVLLPVLPEGGYQAPHQNEPIALLACRHEIDIGIRRFQHGHVLFLIPHGRCAARPRQGGRFPSARIVRMPHLPLVRLRHRFSPATLAARGSS